MHDPRCSHPSTEVTLHSIREKIRHHGWAGMGILDSPTTPFFLYTIGLTETWNHKELLIVGLNPEISLSVIKNAVDLIAEGTKFTEDKEYTAIFEKYNTRFRTIDPNSCLYRFPFSDAYYGEEVPRLQMLWPDADGYFPDDLQCDIATAAVQQV